MQGKTQETNAKPKVVSSPKVGGGGGGGPSEACPKIHCFVGKAFRGSSFSFCPHAEVLGGGREEVGFPKPQLNI